MQGIGDDTMAVPLVDQVSPQVHGLVKGAQLVLDPRIQPLDGLHQTRSAIRDNHLQPAAAKPTLLQIR